MLNIETGKELKLDNIVSLRKKMTQEEVQKEMIKIGMFLNENNLKKNGPVITATFNVEMNVGQAIMDMEILIPVDREVELSNISKYKFKKIFHLVNAVYARHIGNPMLLQNTYNEIMDYINKNNLQPITAGYNVTISDIREGQALDDFIIDVYLGVSPNKL